jgi:hypothetical protein
MFLLSVGYSIVYLLDIVSFIGYSIVLFLSCPQDALRNAVEYCSTLSIKGRIYCFLKVFNGFLPINNTMNPKKEKRNVQRVMNDSIFESPTGTVYAVLGPKAVKSAQVNGISC